MNQLPNSFQLMIMLLLVGAFGCGFYVGFTNDNIWQSLVVPLPIMAVGSLLLRNPVRRAFVESLRMAGPNYLQDVREANKARRWMVWGVPFLAVPMIAAAFARENTALMAIAGVSVGTGFLVLSMNSAFKLQAQQ